MDIKDFNEARKIESSRGSAEWLRMVAMIQYAIEAPDVDQMKSVLWDALHGCIGAGNQKAIHEKYGTWKDYKKSIRKIR